MHHNMCKLRFVLLKVCYKAQGTMERLFTQQNNKHWSRDVRISQAPSKEVDEDAQQVTVPARRVQCGQCSTSTPSHYDVASKLH